MDAGLSKRECLQYELHLFGAVEDESREVVQELGEEGGQTTDVVEIGFGAVGDRGSGGGGASVVLCAGAQDDGGEFEVLIFGGGEGGVCGEG